MANSKPPALVVKKIDINCLKSNQPVKWFSMHINYQNEVTRLILPIWLGYSSKQGY